MKEIIATTEGAQPVGPYSQAIRANGLIFVSGQIPLGMLREVSFLDTTSIHVNAAGTHMVGESPIIR
jgi:2-iminobutanoate/2-iminopropanoate deaminase